MSELFDINKYVVDIFFVWEGGGQRKKKNQIIIRKKRQKKLFNSYDPY